MQNISYKIVQNILGIPAYERHGVCIYHMDCLSAMQYLPENLLNLTVTSPPYNIGKEYEINMDISDYISWCEKWMKEIYRISKDDASFWLNLGYFSVPNKGTAVPISYLLWDKSDFFLLQEIIWNYGAGVACKTRFSPRNEKFLWYVKNSKDYLFNLDDIRDTNVKYPNQRKNGKLRCNPLGKNPSDVWQIPKVTSGYNRSSQERTIHPAQFPVALIERIIKACSHQEDLVFDPFMGSGTTAEVAIHNNRYVIGFEVEKKYIDIAIKRIDNILDKKFNKTSQPLFEFCVENF